MNNVYPKYTKHTFILQHVRRAHLGINVLGIVIVLTKHMILSMVHVLLVDVNVDIKSIHVVQVRNMDFVLSFSTHILYLFTIN